MAWIGLCYKQKLSYFGKKGLIIKISGIKYYRPVGKEKKLDLKSSWVKLRAEKC